MEVGPSAAPITAMEAASLSSKPIKVAAPSVKKMPNCAAAPKIISLGLESSGVKSIIAPMPTNSSNGNSSLAMPASNSTSSGPTSVPVDSTWVTAPDSGRLTRMAPKPIGSSRDGSISFLIASQINRPPIPHITTCCHCRFHRFPNSSCIHSPPCFNAILIQTAKRKRLSPRRGTTPMLGKSLALFHTNYGLSAVLT